MGRWLHQRPLGSDGGARLCHPGGGGNAPSVAPSTSCTSVESTSVSCEGSQCSVGRGAKTGSNGQPLEKLTYEKLFYHIPERKDPDNPKRGGCTGWPYQQGPWCNSKLKVRINFGFPDILGTMVQLGSQEDSLTDFPSAAPTEGTGAPNSRQEFSQSPRRRGAKKNIVHLLGIAADEPERIARYIDKPGYLLPLVEAGWDEDLCGLWCQYEGLLSPVYENACRSGCWFCHNQGVDQLRLLRRNYPDLWALLLKWDKDSPVTFHADGHTVHDFDRRFALEDERKIPTDKRFRWKMLDDPPKFVAYEGEQISMRI